MAESNVPTILLPGAVTQDQPRAINTAFSKRFVGYEKMARFEAYDAGRGLASIGIIIQAFQKLNMSSIPISSSWFLIEWAMNFSIATNLRVMLQELDEFHDFFQQQEFDEGAYDYLCETLPDEHLEAAREVMLLEIYPKFFNPHEDVHWCTRNNKQLRLEYNMIGQRFLRTRAVRHSILDPILTRHGIAFNPRNDTDHNQGA